MLSQEEIAQSLMPIFQKYNIQKSILFGSFAQQDATRKSDLDLLLVKETKERFFDRYEGIYKEIVLALDCLPVDLLIYTPEELTNISYRKFISRILKEGVTIYEQGKTPL